MYNFTPIIIRSALVIIASRARFFCVWIAHWSEPATVISSVASEPDGKMLVPADEPATGIPPEHGRPQKLFQGGQKYFSNFKGWGQRGAK
jgi:hypothetical protein